MRFPYFIAILAFGAAMALQEWKPQKSVTDKVTFGFNERRPTLSADTLELISFGYPRFFSSLLWLRFLQLSPIDRVPDGELSWIYFDLDTITTIDPDFYPAFEHAGIYLSVVTNDKKGAQLLFEKGVRLHPNRWRIRAYLAYHYQFEVDQPEKAVEQYFAASRLEGAPSLMGILAARHLARTESIQRSIEFLESLKEASKDERAKQNFEERIQTWKKKLKEKEDK
ncbi:MAG: tetratricopeptide repeat protein [Bdellovibrionota bacterium]